MDTLEFERLVQRYKAGLMQMAARSRGTAEPSLPDIPQKESAERQNPSGAAQDPLDPLEAEKVSYAVFMKENPKTGLLRVQVSSASRTLPVPGARVTVTRDFTEGQKTFAAMLTDKNGVADDIPLPAPDQTKSQTPSSTQPYATYDVTVSHPDYRKEYFPRVAVFEGIKSIQPVNFLPVSANAF